MYIIRNIKLLLITLCFVASLVLSGNVTTEAAPKKLKAQVTDATTSAQSPTPIPATSMPVPLDQNPALIPSPSLTPAIAAVPSQATPSAQPTASPTPSASPSATAVPQSLPVESAIASPTASASAVGGRSTPSPAPVQQTEQTPQPSPQPSPTPTPEPTVFVTADTQNEDVQPIDFAKLANDAFTSLANPITQLSTAFDQQQDKNSLRILLITSVGSLISFGLYILRTHFPV